MHAIFHLTHKNNTAPHDRKKEFGYLCGIISGIAYGLNPLFGLPLLNEYHLSLDTVLFYRYVLAAVVLASFLGIRRRFVPITIAQGGTLGCLGILFALSSLFLFAAYKYIPSGISTTIVFLYPVLVALIMVILKEYPTWQKWVAIGTTFVGVILLCQPSPGASYHWLGFLFSFLSAFVYAIFIVIINKNKSIEKIPAAVLSLYTLITGCIIFLIHSIPEGISWIPDMRAFFLLLGLGLMPTLVSMAALSFATRTVGATTASVLGVLEPLTAIGIGVLIFDEGISLSIIIGACLTIGAIVFMTITDHTKPNNT